MIKLPCFSALNLPKAKETDSIKIGQTKILMADSFSYNFINDKCADIRIYGKRIMIKGLKEGTVIVDCYDAGKHSSKHYIKFEH